MAAVETPNRLMGPRLSTGLIAIYGALILVAIATTMPFLWMVATSVKYDPDIFSYPPRWLPTQRIEAGVARPSR